MSMKKKQAASGPDIELGVIVVQQDPAASVTKPSEEGEGEEDEEKESKEKLSAEWYLERILGTYELATSIAAECHYSDFTALMMVSKRLRGAVIGSIREDILRKMTCKEMKSDCWGCGGQMCGVGLFLFLFFIFFTFTHVFLP